jgi:hypothetical protein
VPLSSLQMGAQFTEMWFGSVVNLTVAGYTFRIDDLAYDTADWIGPETSGFTGTVAVTQAAQTLAASGTFTEGASQLLRPIATTQAGAWTVVGAATLHEAVDEETATFDDHIVSEADPQNSPVVLRLAPLVEPGGTVNDDDVTVNVQYDREGGTATTNLVIQLRQGYVNEGSPGTLIASATDSDVTDAAEAGVLSLTAAEYGNIVFAAGVASDLDVRIVADLT